MQQERDGEGEDVKQQNHQDQRRVKAMQGENQQQNQQPQKCPRCESLNTKFCYYNNYSLSQPRYFCKTCRRYWTQGGTLRNVPVGGGCRKGKRAKTTSSSSGENSRSSTQQPQQQNLTNPPPTNTIPSNPVIQTSPPALRTTKELGSIPSIAPYYAGGGYLSSLGAIQSFSQSLHHVGGSSNMDLLQGFTLPSFGSQQQQFYQMGNRDRSMEHLYPRTEENLIQSSRPTSSSQQDDWHQGFMMSNTNPPPSDPALWSFSTITSTTGNSNSNNNNAGSTFNIPSQWPNLPGYGPPP
jgi:hypothetical protein